MLLANFNRKEHLQHHTVFACGSTALLFTVTFAYAGCHQLRIPAEITRLFQHFDANRFKVCRTFLFQQFAQFFFSFGECYKSHIFTDCPVMLGPIFFSTVL